MINVPCILPSMSAIAIALTNIPVMIHTISIISMPIFPGVSLWHSTWWSWSLLPYVYAQINGYCHHYYPECYVWTHTSTYGCEGRFWGTCIQWKKNGSYEISLPMVFYQPPGDFYTPDPDRIWKKDFQTQNGVSPVRLCCQPLTVSAVRLCATLAHAYPSYPLCHTLPIIWSHKSPSSPVCMAGGGGW